jgi:hypothetical protein
MCQLAPGTWSQALAGVLGVSPGGQGDNPSHPVVEIAIYPDGLWLAARSLRAHSPATAPLVLLARTDRTCSSDVNAALFQYGHCSWVLTARPWPR